MCTCSVELAGTEDEVFVHGVSESAEKVTLPGSHVMVTVVTFGFGFAFGFEFGRVIRWRLPRSVVRLHHILCIRRFPGVSEARCLEIELRV
jgi:hypothetical protein